MLVPVERVVLVGLVARGVLGLAVPGDLPAVLAGASGLRFGAGGFFVGGAVSHARMIAHHPLGCKWVVEVYSNFFRGLHLAPTG